ncbi:hypothetical protein PV04_03479 [Phialophora macrospora]|uniref:Uncharacterized protein n=1 Tax=Phialophora macrospora TaxID=1851006 RepID=A0A0D2EAF2_9EURO|nr:hypothetical protein PV04_03479 [Phialophora macrospora]
MSLNPSSSNSYTATLESLLPPSCPHHVLSLPVSPCKPHVPSHTISDLSVHPVLESGLHILNMDLPAAHFLLRHMQAAPAWEAMYLHGLLHRIEGDLDNTRAWYGDVKESAAFKWVWGGMNSERDGSSNKMTSSEEAFQSAMSFLDGLEVYKNSLLPAKAASHRRPSGKDVPVEAELADVSLREIRRLLSFCEEKFGIDSVGDASDVWVSMSEKHADKANQMISGGEGWRVF